jgi:hypothetical protein
MVTVALACSAACDRPARNNPGSGGAGVGATGGAAGGAGTGGAPGDNASSDGRRLRRLSNREYDNVVRELLGDTSHPARDFIADAYPNGYDNGSTALTIQSDQADALQVAAEQLAARAAADLPRLFGDCNPDPAATTAKDAGLCVDRFLDRFPGRAYRRVLTTLERARLRALYDEGAQSGGAALGAQLVIEAVLQSPQFLYREELGESGAPAPGVPAGFVRLSPFELASELSFLMTGSLPDPTLWAAVAEGRFSTAEDLRREARRLRESAAAATTLRTFLHQWLATDRLPLVIKDAAVYPRFSRALADSMLGELDRYYDHVLGAGGGSLRTLFTSTTSFLDAPLADIYAVPVPDGGDAGGFAATSLDGTSRRGVLTRAGYLTVHADLDSSGPIPRGVFLLDQILCLPPPPPPANIPAAPSPADDAMNKRTTRARFGAHVDRADCAACHTLIDGYGFGFEEFDGIGAHRTVENEVPVDSSGTVRGTGDTDGPFVGVSQLSDRLVGSRRLRDCFVRQVYRFAMGQVETTVDRPLLDALAAGFTVDTPVANLLMALVERPEFSLRRIPVEAGGGAP